MPERRPPLAEHAVYVPAPICEDVGVYSADLVCRCLALGAEGERGDRWHDLLRLLVRTGS